LILKKEKGNGSAMMTLPCGDLIKINSLRKKNFLILKHDAPDTAANAALGGNQSSSRTAEVTHMEDTIIMLN
jgi:hypothetical protein